MNCSLCHERILKGWAYVRKHDVVCKDCKKSISKKKPVKVDDGVDVTISFPDRNMLLCVCANYLASYGFHVSDFYTRQSVEQKNFKHMDHMYDNFRIKEHWQSEYVSIRPYTEVSYNAYKKLITKFLPNLEDVKKVHQEHPIIGNPFDPRDIEASDSYYEQFHALNKLPLFGKLTQKEIDCALELTAEQISIFEGLLRWQTKYRKLRKKPETVLAKGAPHGYVGESNSAVILQNHLYVQKHVYESECYLEVAKVNREPFLNYFTLPIKNTDTRGDKETINSLNDKICDLKNLHSWLENQ